MDAALRPTGFRVNPDLHIDRVEFIAGSTNSITGVEAQNPGPICDELKELDRIHFVAQS